MKNIFLSVFLFTLTVASFAQDNNLDINNYLKGLSEKNILSKDDIQDYKITDTHISKKSKVLHLYFRQTHNGLEIVGTESGLHILTNGQIISRSNKFIKNINEKMQQVSASEISPRQAILSVAQQMGYTVSQSLNRVNDRENQDPNKVVFSTGGISNENIPVKKIYYSRPFEKPVLAYELSIYEISKKHWYNFYVNAETGDIIIKNDWKTSCTIDHEHVHEVSTKIEKTESRIDISSSKNAATLEGEGTYNVYALPKESPFFGPRTLEVDPHDLLASPFGWHDTDGVVGPEYTVTRGNNVSAYEDGDNPGFQPDGGLELLFDFPVNEVYSTIEQSEAAAITNLFYWNNIIHDVLHYYGFDEESGNFQTTNYSGLGIGNDHVNAEAQDSSGSCNANFYTPPDGTSGVMQMYTCSTRDGDFDNHVIIHEYGHGISNRLTGGASNSDCLFNDEQMGEGWSDWYGNILTMTASDLPTDLQPVGNWLFGQAVDGPGIRDYPYTTDLTQDPRTYDYIKSTFGPHPLGSTWAAMLWELTWSLIDQYGFDEDVYNGTGGNNIALALVTEALKLQPCSPGFVDGRDAILAADLALYGGANECLIWDAFAKRGLGFSAIQGSSNSRTDGTEAFDSLSTSLNIEEESFCFFENAVILGGGIPVGGVYSGPGVTDNGDGLSFTFDPNSAGVGSHVITYTAVSVCATGTTDTDTIEVTDGQPEILCQDIEVALDASGSAVIVPEDIITNFSPGEGYTLDQTGTFAPEDLSGIGTTVSLSDDQVSTDLPIGFDFIFYNNTFNTFRISSNGFITFDTDGSSGCCSGQNIPNVSTPNNLIAFGWTDLYPPGNGSIVYTTIGSAPNRILIVDVVDIPFCCDSDGKVTTQVKLFESANRIEIHSTSVEGISMTQGIENPDGTDALPVPDRNSATFTINNDFVAFIPNSGGFPDNCGLETTLTLDVDTFDCTNIGENTVTATVTDTNGNTASCTSIVTIVPTEGISFDLNNTTFCIDEGLVTGLGGASPEGGVYSGTGVTDDGNGTTFSFDPAVVGVGIHTITYESSNSCGSQSTVSADVEVLSAIPDIACQDITIPLNLNGTVTINPVDILLGGNSAGSLYALDPFISNNNIALYNYDPLTDIITVDSGFLGSTQIERGYSLDANPVDGEVYIMSATSNSSPRQLFTFDIATANGGALLIDTITSVTGNTQPQDMAFGGDGTLYFSFSSGEINSYNLGSQTMTALATVTNSGSVGLTYDYDNNRLLHATGNGSVTITEIDISTGASTPLFTASLVCGAQAIEYIGNNKVIASSTSGCNTIYTLDLATQQSTVLLNPSGTFTSIKDLMYLGGLPTDNCNGEPLTFSLDQSDFDCTDVGVNTVTVTATDGQGNQSSCTATVTIELPDSGTIELALSNQVFCEDEGLSTGLGGGNPEGGVYSGTGVTDDGNGSTFSFNPSIAGIGTHTITYTLDSCGTSISTSSDVEVLSAIPEIVCQDITIPLDLNGTVTITAADILTGGSANGSLYAINSESASTNDIALYSYDPLTDAIILDSTFSGSTQISRSFALDTNPVNGEVYLMGGADSSAPRQLFVFDIETANGGGILIETITSVLGNTQPQDMTFGSDGTLYFVFNGGEVNSYNIATQTMTALTTVTSAGGVGLTYDYDNNRLLYATGSGTAELYEVDINTGNVNSLFTFNPSSTNTCTAQAIEYVGDDKLIASSTFGCDIIYTVDLNTQLVTTLLNPTGSYTRIKDFMYLGGLPTDNCNGEPLTFSLDQSDFDCTNVGANTVTVTATDSQGNQSSCTATVTIDLPDSGTIDLALSNQVFCEDEGLVTGLGGGSPEGGVYSGNGVIDNGNGTTFSFDTSIVGEGIHTITYSLDSCGTPISASSDVEVLSAIPEIVCQDITIALEADDTVSIDVFDILLGGNGAGNLYALDPFATINNIALYNYDPLTDSITVDNGFLGSTQIARGYSMDNNPVDGEIYLMSATSSSAPRQLFTFDIATANGGALLIDTITSVTGNTQPQDMAFGSDGTLYFTFSSGEINSYNLGTQTMTALSTVTNSGSVGLTYDYDNNRLLHATGNGSVSISEIDLSTGASSPLFTASLVCGAQAIEYIGNNKVIVSSTGGCNTIYTLDLATQQSTILLNPSGTFTSIKDLMYLGGLPTDNCNGEQLTFSLDQSDFDCTNLGSNTVTITAMDNQGNSVTCVSIVTVEDLDDSCELSIDDYTLDGLIDIYPNPIKDVLTINWNGIELDNLAIYDLRGRLIKSLNLKGQQLEKQINFSDFSNGVYLLKIKSTNNRELIQKVIKN